MDSLATTITFQPSGKTLQVNIGTPLMQAAEIAGVDIGVPCGGKGRCGKCKVIFQQGAPAPTPTEQEMLTETEVVQGYRLGCQTVISEDAVVLIPDAHQPARILTTGATRQISLMPSITKKCVRVPEPGVDDLRSDLKRVLDGLEVESTGIDLEPAMLRQLAGDIRQAGFEITGVFADGKPIAFEPGDTTPECYGAAIDIGTTTLAAYLIDLNTGAHLSVAAAMNPQAKVGDDVISRISHVMDEPNGLNQLRILVVDQINDLLRDLVRSADVSLERIYDASIVGNTCMMHLLLGLNPRNLATAPYVPVASQSMSVGAHHVGIEINEFGRVHLLPGIAGYVGADTVGVVLASALHENDGISLAVDIGTNGEIVLGSKDRMLACSTAAGPAFEGAHIKHGMRAAPGAIDAVWFDDGDISFSTIGNVDAAGICGSGLLDAIVCLVYAGIIEPSGRIVDAGEIPDRYAALAEGLRAGEQGNEFVLATQEKSGIDGPVVITQRDVREVQLAKGAIAAGIQTLMDRLGVGTDELDAVILAGAFGNYVRKESAIAAGLLPGVPLSKIHSVGNAAGEGAKLALTSLEARRDADRIADSVEYVELTTDIGFQERFADALMFGGISRV